VVAVDIPHHVTQRGNARQFVLSSDAERAVYLGLLREHAGLHGLSILGYCLMSNHVHLVVIPRTADALTVVLKQTHGRYAAYWNSSHCSSGHVWQGRYYSCPLGEGHLWEALRYAELNPVRAGMVAEASAWEWSSAAAHSGLRPPDACLEMSAWEKRWGVSAWDEYLRQGGGESELSRIRQCTHTGRPLGSADFVKELERSTQRRLAPRKGGRPPQPAIDQQQSELGFDW
jgi:putative transposase